MPSHSSAGVPATLAGIGLISFVSLRDGGANILVFRSHRHRFSGPCIPIDQSKSITPNKQCFRLTRPLGSVAKLEKPGL